MQWGCTSLKRIWVQRPVSVFCSQVFLYTSLYGLRRKVSDRIQFKQLIQMAFKDYPRKRSVRFVEMLACLGSVFGVRLRSLA
jgi:hypothetical protein